MKRLIASILLLTAGAHPANSARRRPHEKGAEGNAHADRIVNVDSTRAALVKAGEDRSAEITPILAQKHAAIRLIMDDKTSSESQKKSQIGILIADFDARVSAVYTRTAATIDAILAADQVKERTK